MCSHTIWTSTIRKERKKKERNDNLTENSTHKRKPRMIEIFLSWKETEINKKTKQKRSFIS